MMDYIKHYEEILKYLQQKFPLAADAVCIEAAECLMHKTIRFAHQAVEESHRAMKEASRKRILRSAGALSDTNK